MDPLAVGIIEDQREIREGLAALIGGTPGFECTGTFRSVEEALAPLQARPPQVLLLDVGLPGMSGIEGIPLLKARCPGLALLMLTVYNDDDRIIQAVCAGACGYLLKKTPPARLLECLREVADGGAPMSPEVARRVMTLFREYRPPEKAEYQLTPHETRLLAAPGRGPQLQDGRHGDRRHRPRHLLPHAAHLREARGPLQVRSRRQGPAPGPRPLASPSHYYPHA